MASNNKNDKMLSGSIASSIILFSLPIMLGNLFQKLYNTVDAVVVGQFLTDEDLAAISIGTPLMDVIYALIIGACIGISVIISQAYGAKDWSKLKNSLSTALIGGCIATAVLCILCIIFIRPILELQGADAAAADKAAAYLSIIIYGLIITFLYNLFSSALRAVGDSRTPCISLILAFFLNTALNLLFVNVFKSGLAGTAYATVISQAFSTWICIRAVYKNQPFMALRRGDFKFSHTAGISILKFSWAGSLQQTVVNLGRMITQSFLYTLPIHIVSGYNMAIRIEALHFCLIQGISAALVTFLAQNVGAKQFDRIRRGVFSAELIAMIMCTFSALMFTLFAPQIISIFSPSKDIIDAGAVYLRTMAFAYLLAASCELTQSFYRGIGRIHMTVIVSISQIVIRVVLSYLLVPIFGIVGICYSIMVGWILMFIFSGGYTLHTLRTKF